MAESPPNATTMKIPPYPRSFLVFLLMPLLALFAMPWLQAQTGTLVPSTTTLDAANRVKVSFATTAGKNYRVEHTTDFLTWTFYPGSIYGLGQTADYYVYEGEPPASAPPPPAGGPDASEFYLFFVTAFNDGSAVASWAGASGQPCQAYLASFDMRNAGVILTGVVSPTVTPAAPAVPYNLTVFVSTGTKLAAYTSLTVPTGETTTLQKLSSQATTVKNALINQASNPTQPLPPRLFDDRGQPLHQFFRVKEFEVDSNYDGVPDHTQLVSNPSATYNQDLDSDGIPNGYDRDMVPQATDPARYALLSNVLINEVLMSNDFINTDEDSQSNDWVELYNPTNAAINIGGWFLSDSGGSNRTKWTIPAGTTIGSGQFLVVWASGKNRTNPAQPLHTNFSFGAGNYITGANPEPVYLSRDVSGTLTTVDYFVPGATANYGPQRPDVSFGRYPIATLVSGMWRTSLQTGYMLLPTAGTQVAAGKFSGAHNITGALGFTNPPVFSGSNPGIYTDTSTPPAGGPPPPGPGDPGFPAPVDPASPPTVIVTLAPPAGGGAVHFTTNGANPTRYSELYPGTFGTNRTLVVRAIAAKEGYLPSYSVTRSFLFKEDILGTSDQGITPTDQQGARDANNDFKGLLYKYPEATENSAYPMLYHMESSAVAAKKNTLGTELGTVPVISIVSSVPDFFEQTTGGLYPNSGQTENNDAGDPRGRDWERFCSFEIIEPGNTTFKQSNAAVLITGGSSIRQNTTRKHNLRIKFDATYGPESLVYPLFPGSGIPQFYNFNLKNTTHDSWSSNWGQNNGYGLSFNTNATYSNEAFIIDTHRAMGHDGPNTRWSHVFINGIYWGPYQIIERIDDKYAEAHFGGAGWDVIKQSNEAVSGNYSEWTTLTTLVNTFPSTPEANKPALYAQITSLVDMPNYVDYLVAYTYAQASDWPSNNWRAAKLQNSPSAKWKFLVWDAEWSLRQGEQSSSPVSKISGGAGPAIIHSKLKDYQPYRDFFSQRVNRAFKVIPGDAGSGALITATAKTRFQTAINRFGTVVNSESARWGYMAQVSGSPVGPLYTKTHWDTATSYILNTWIHNRQTPFLNAYQSAGLYVPTP
jgi:hypothetical protein